MNAVAIEEMRVDLLIPAGFGVRLGYVIVNVAAATVAT